MEEKQIMTPKNEQSQLEKQIQKEKILKVLKYVLLYTFLCIMAIGVIIPFYWMLLVSLKTTKELEAPIQSLFTLHPQWINYKIALTTPGTTHPTKPALANNSAIKHKNFFIVCFLLLIFLFN